MKLIFADQAWEDYLYWQQQDRRMLERINKLIREIQRSPFVGIGNREAGASQARASGLLVAADHR